MFAGDNFNKLDVWLTSEGVRMGEHDTREKPVMIQGIPTVSCFVEVEKGKTFSINVNMGGKAPWGSDLIADITIDKDRIHALFIKRNHQAQLLDKIYHTDQDGLKMSSMAFGEVVERIDFPTDANAVDDGEGSVVVDIRRGKISTTSTKTQLISQHANNVGKNLTKGSNGLAIVPAETSWCEGDSVQFKEEFRVCDEERDERRPWIRFVFKYRSRQQLVRDRHLRWVPPQQYPGQGKITGSTVLVKKRSHSLTPAYGDKKRVKAGQRVNADSSFSSTVSHSVHRIKRRYRDPDSPSPPPKRAVHEVKAEADESGDDLRALAQSVQDTQSQRIADMEGKINKMSEVIERLTVSSECSTQPLKHVKRSTLSLKA